MESILWTQGSNNKGIICSEEGVFKWGEEGYNRLNKEFTKWFAINRWDYEDKSLRLYSDNNKVVISSFFSDVDSSGRKVTFAYLGDSSSVETSIRDYSQKMGYTVPEDTVTIIMREIEKKKGKTKRIRKISAICLFIIIVLSFLGIVILTNR